MGTTRTPNAVRWATARDRGQSPVNPITFPIAKVELPETRNAIGYPTSAGSPSLHMGKACANGAVAALIAPETVHRHSDPRDCRGATRVARRPAKSSRRTSRCGHAREASSPRAARARPS